MIDTACVTAVHDKLLCKDKKAAISTKACVSRLKAVNHLSAYKNRIKNQNLRLIVQHNKGASLRDPFTGYLNSWPSICEITTQILSLLKKTLARAK